MPLLSVSVQQATVKNQLASAPHQASKVADMALVLVVVMVPVLVVVMAPVLVVVME